MSPAADAGASWLHKWRSAEPEMEFAEPFVPRHLRPRVRAWGSWLAEMDHSLLSPSEPQLALRRLGWWLEELGRERPQHPLAISLSAEGAGGVHAARVVAAALELAGGAHDAADTGQALAALQGYAGAVADAECALFACTDAANVDRDATRQSVAIGLLGRRLPRVAEAPLLRQRLPLNLLARHDGDLGPPLVAAVATELLARSPVDARLPLYRALRWQLDRATLRRLATGRTPPAGRPSSTPLQATWLSWRAARRAAPTPGR